MAHKAYLDIMTNVPPISSNFFPNYKLKVIDNTQYLATVVQCPHFETFDITYLLYFPFVYPNY